MEERAYSDELNAYCCVQCASYLGVT